MRLGAGAPTAGSTISSGPCAGRASATSCGGSRDTGRRVNMVTAHGKRGNSTGNVSSGPRERFARSAYDYLLPRGTRNERRFGRCSPCPRGIFLMRFSRSTERSLVRRPGAGRRSPLITLILRTMIDQCQHRASTHSHNGFWFRFCGVPWTSISTSLTTGLPNGGSARSSCAIRSLPSALTYDTTWAGSGVRRSMPSWPEPTLVR